MQQDQQFYENFFSTHSVSVHDNPDRFVAVSALLFGSVLDVGCGTGTLTDYYSDDYVGFDWSGTAIAQAREVRRKDALFTIGDFTKNLVFHRKQFDSVYVGEFLEHVKDDDVVFQNIIMASMPKARVVVSVPNGDRVPDESHCRIFTVASIRRDYSKYGKVRFHSWSGDRERILFSIELAANQADEITLVMIVKDEAKGIERAILSALPLVDRVVVSVDSKTTDSTREIAALYADELKEHIWRDNFSEARNSAQEGVTSKWILFLDGHEYIEKMGKLKEYLMIDVEGIFVTVKMETGMTFLFPRVYRSFVKFKNAVHNLNECKTQRACPDFLIVHDREHGQSDEAVKRRNQQRETMLPKIMKDQLKSDPNNLRALFHLGNWYMMIREYNEALKYYERYLKIHKHPEEGYMVQLNVGLCHATLGHHIRAMWAFRRADKMLPDRWETARVVGGLYYLTGRWKKAAKYLIQALGPNMRAYLYQPMQANLLETWDMIGHCFAQIDENEKAIMAWERAKTHAKTQEEKNMVDNKIALVKTLIIKS